MKKILVYVFLGLFIISGIGLNINNINTQSQLNAPTTIQNINSSVTPSTNAVNTNSNDTVSPVEAGQTTKPVTKPIKSTATKAEPTPPKPSCIVTISGKKYDVINLRKTHSGGDVFTCNTDMTSTFFSMHGQSLLNNQMSKYLVK